MTEINTLADAVDQYLIQKQINKKKYYASYLFIAKSYWRKLFRNTIYSVNSEWKTLKAGTPYNYIDVPKGMVRLFSVAETNHCNEIVPLFYNNTVNIITKPTSSQRKCGCDSCECGGLCEDVNSLTYSTKVLFTINGTDYVEKDWVKVCPNGDVIQYRIVPTKKYNTFVGDGGDYSNDYMNDYDIGAPPFSDYTIVYPEFQNIICKLDVEPCGCPKNTQENIDLINNHCGCYLPVNAYCKKIQCDSFLGQINNYGDRGTVKMSECGTKIYYIPHPNFRNKKEKPLPEFLLVNYQLSGENCNEYVQVPEYSLECMWAGINYYSIRYNNSYSINEKLDAKYNMNSMENDLILFLNPINLEYLSTVQDTQLIF